VYLDRKYFYRRTLSHILKDNRAVFVTFATFKRWRIPEPSRDLVLTCCRQLHGIEINLHVVVVMPDHIHLLFTPLRNSEGWVWSLPQILRLIKGRSARLLNKNLRRSGPVWQDEFFDHVLRGSECLLKKSDYIRQNPVRAGLVSKAEDYPWLWRSSTSPHLDGA
jgi:putative transposase